MLCLKNNTKTDWIIVALQNINEVIIDHAHCEKKAAATGLSLIFNYPDKVEISLTMSDLVEEEIGHYRSVIKILYDKKISLTRGENDSYVHDLLVSLRKSEPHKLLDRLLIAGIIEARSCERLQILAAHLEDVDLKNFYKQLSDTEAGHYVTFIKLATLYFDENRVKARLDELTDLEAKIVENLPNLPLIHG